jgi:hypothetical protein
MHASGVGGPSAVPREHHQALGEALGHMIAALRILDENDVSPIVGARLEQAIETLRDELA